MSSGALVTASSLLAAPLFAGGWLVEATFQRSDTANNISEPLNGTLEPEKKKVNRSQKSAKVKRREVKRTRQNKVKRSHVDVLLNQLIISGSIAVGNGKKARSVHIRSR